MHQNEVGRIAVGDRAATPSEPSPSVSGKAGIPCAADFTVADVLAWARTKPAEERYTYTDSGNCALCQFLRETDRCALPSVGPAGYSDMAAADWQKSRKLPRGANRAVIGRDEGDWSKRTFGGLVVRLEALCPAPVTQSNWSAIDAYLLDIESMEA